MVKKLAAKIAATGRMIMDKMEHKRKGNVIFSISSIWTKTNSKIIVEFLQLLLSKQSRDE